MTQRRVDPLSRAAVRAKIRSRRPVPPMLALSEEEEQRLVAAASEEPWRTLVGLMLRAGLRRGEALQLRAGQVDLEAGRVTIPTREPMGRARRVELPGEVSLTLRSLMAGLDPDARVFPGLNSESAWLRGWREVARTAELEGVAMHRLRATFGARAAATRRQE